MSTDPGREQNWYPISKLGWFTSHIRERVEATSRQMELLQPARARPYLLDDARGVSLTGPAVRRRAASSGTRGSSAGSGSHQYGGSGGLHLSDHLLHDGGHRRQLGGGFDAAPGVPPASPVWRHDFQ